MAKLSGSSSAAPYSEHAGRKAQEPATRGDALTFRVLVRNIACEIVDGKDLESLCFLQGVERPGSALEVFRGMMRRGIFSCTNVGPLKKTLEDIDRFDLITRHLDTYQLQQNSAIPSTQAAAKGFHRVMSAPTQNMLPRARGHYCHSESSIPATSYQLPFRDCSSANILQEGEGSALQEGDEGEMRADPEKSLLVSGMGKWHKDYHQSKNLDAKSAPIDDTYTTYAPPPPLDDHTHQTPPTSAVPLSPVMNVPPSFSPHPEKVSDLLMGSVVSRKSMEQQIVGHMELEDSLNQFSLPYTTSAPRDTTSTPTQGRDTTSTPTQGGDTTSTPTQGRDTTSAPTQGGDTTSTPTQGRDTTSASTQGRDTTSAPTQGGDTTSTPTQGRDTTSTPTQGRDAVNTGGASYFPHSGTNIRQCDSNLSPGDDSVTQSLSLLQGKSQEYTSEGKVQLNTEALSLWIGDRQKIGVPFHKQHIPIKCCSRLPPSVTVEVFPRASLTSESLLVRATLLIPSRCSRHKWLVHYADSAFHLSCSLTRRGENTAIRVTAKEEGIVSPSDAVLEDHETVLSLDVLDHSLVLYDKTEFFTLHLVAKVMVHGFHGDESAKLYKVVGLEGDEDGLEIVRFATPPPTQ